MTTKTEYHEGDLVRVTDIKTNEGFQTRVRRHTPGSALFLSKDWGARWEDWTFLSWYESHPEKYKLELLERAPEPPREKGWYKEPDATLWYWDGEHWRDSDQQDDYEYSTDPMNGEVERLYTKDEVMAKVRAEAWRTDPGYIYGTNDLLTVIDGLEAKL